MKETSWRIWPCCLIFPELKQPEIFCQNICLEAAQGRDLPGPDTLNVGTGTAPGLASPQVPAASGETSPNPSQHPGEPHWALGKTPKTGQTRKQTELATPSVPSQGTAAEMKNILSRGKAPRDAGCAQGAGTCHRVSHCRMWAGGWHLSLPVPLQELCLCLPTAGSQVPAGGHRGERPPLSFPLRRASK